MLGHSNQKNMWVSELDMIIMILIMIMIMIIWGSLRSLTTVILGMRAWKVGPILVSASRSNSGKPDEFWDRTFLILRFTAAGSPFFVQNWHCLRGRNAIQMRKIPLQHGMIWPFFCRPKLALLRLKFENKNSAWNLKGKLPYSRARKGGPPLGTALGEEIAHFSVYKSLDQIRDQGAPACVKVE